MHAVSESAVSTLAESWCIILQAKSLGMRYPHAPNLAVLRSLKNLVKRNHIVAWSNLVRAVCPFLIMCAISGSGSALQLLLYYT